MLKIRLMRIGAKKKPFYRVVAVDERAKRTGGYLELLGTYNPLTEPKDIKLKQDRIDYWIKQGAQASDGYLRIIGKAPQRPPRKPRKERKESESQKNQEESKLKEVKSEEKAKQEEAQTTPKENVPVETPAEVASEQSNPSTEQAESEKKNEGSA